MMILKAYIVWLSYHQKKGSDIKLSPGARGTAKKKKKKTEREKNSAHFTK